MDSLISVIVPVYNVGKYLRRCVESITGQTKQELEIILVDDGSTDDCPGLCDYYAGRDVRVKVVHKGNGGLVSARKAGLEVASGEYIGYVDGDDWIERDFYETLYRYMEQYQADMVETGHFMDMGTGVKRMEGKLPCGRYCTEELVPVMLCDGDFNECRMQPYLWSKLFKRGLLEKCQMEADERLQCGEDMAVVYPYILGTGNVYIGEYAGYHYVQHQDSMTGMDNIGGWERDRLLIRYLKEAFERDANYSGSMLRQLNQYAKSMLLLRQPGFLDCFSGGGMLTPFGGVEGNQRVALYGAGRMGRSLYRYLELADRENAVMWGDREYALYGQFGMPVVSPEEIVGKQRRYDRLVIAVGSRKLAQGIRDFLEVKGMEKGKMAWLTEEFTSGGYDVLELLFPQATGQENAFAIDAEHLKKKQGT